MHEYSLYQIIFFFAKLLYLRTYSLECNRRNTIFWRTIYKSIWVDKIDQAIRIFIIKSDNSKFFEEEARTFIPYLFRLSYRLTKDDISSLSTWYRGIAGILSKAKSTRYPSCFSTTIEACDTSYFRIWDTSHFDLMIWANQLECCIDTPYLIGILRSTRYSILRYRGIGTHIRKTRTWSEKKYTQWKNNFWHKKNCENKKQKNLNRSLYHSSFHKDSYEDALIVSSARW